MAIAFCSFAVIAVEVLDCFSDPAAYHQGKTTLRTIMGTLVGWFGHALWLSMDRRRRGLEIGGWRFGVIFFGPLAIWLYLTLEYRLRALYLIPLSITIYAAIGLAILLASAIGSQFA